MPRTIDFQRLSGRMRTYSSAVPLGVRRMAQHAMLHTVEEVIKETPVDRGTLRSNWVVTVGGVFTGVLPAYFPGKKLGKNERRNYYAALGKAIAVLQSFTTKDVLNGSFLNLSNNIGYLDDVNSPPGKSKQTAPLFVERAIQFGQISIKNFRVLEAGGAGQIASRTTFDRVTGGRVVGRFPLGRRRSGGNISSIGSGSIGGGSLLGQ